MKNDNNFFEGAGIVAVLVRFIDLFIFTPLFSFFINYFGGWICKIIFGDILCNSLNVLFNTNTFVPENLPIIAGALGWIAGFFKSISLSKIFLKSINMNKNKK